MRSCSFFQFFRHIGTGSNCRVNISVANRNLSTYDTLCVRFGNC
jgi:hypothetical protein